MNGDITGSILLTENGFLKYNLNSANKISYRFKYSAKEESLDNGSSREFVYFGKELETTSVGSDDRGDEALKWFGLDFDFAK